MWVCLWSTLKALEQLIIENSGHAMLSPDYRFILLSNLSNGLDLYPLGKSSVLQSYRYTPVPERNFPFTADFVCHGEAVICGSPVGKVSVWKTKTGERVQTLSHDGDYILHSLRTPLLTPLLQEQSFNPFVYAVPPPPSLKSRE